MLSNEMISADPVTVGGDSVWKSPPREGKMKDHITVKGQDGTFAAYIARPKTSPAPAVVVQQELFGVNADIRKTCDELAEQGFIAVARPVLASGAGCRSQRYFRTRLATPPSPLPGL
jgi:hypothetical protein